MNASHPVSPAGPPSELERLRRRVEALSRKRDAAEGQLRALLASLLPLDDLLADTRRRAGALYAPRSARETASLAVALSEQIDAAQTMLRGELARCDVRPMEVVGRAADPVEMRVAGAEPHPTVPEGAVLREEATGFRLGTSVLRPARVIVAVPGPAPEPEPEPYDVTAPDTSGPARGERSQPRRVPRSRRGLPRKPSARRKRRRRRT